MYAQLLAIAGVAAAATTSTVSGTNILPTAFPVTAFPETTQTHFDSPSCTTGPSSTQELTVNYNFETVERIDALSATTPIGVYNLLRFIDINGVDTDVKIHPVPIHLQRIALMVSTGRYGRQSPRPGALHLP